MSTPAANPIPHVKFACLVCQAEMVVRQPMAQIVNSASVSGVLFAHERLDRCPACGAQYVCLVEGVDGERGIILKWIPVQTKQSAIVPGTQANVDQTMKNMNIAGRVKLT